MINLPQKFKKPVVSKKLAAIIFFAILILAGFGFAEKTLAYATSGNWTSTNLLSGKTVSSINSFVYNLSSLPANTTSTVQFSNDNSNWRDSSGNSGQWDTMSQGSHSIDLSALGWTTANFYYRVQFTSDGTNTPVLDDIKVKYFDSDSVNFVIDSFGRVGIGTTSPDVSLEVGTVGDATSTVRLRVHGSIEASGAITPNTGSDIAERFLINSQCEMENTCPEVGDLVSIGENQIIYKSLFPYDSKLIGIVSENPAITMGGGLDASGSRPVALAGRVSTKVSLENGAIEVGDPLTSSNQPGVAMKATEPGRVIGLALEPFNGLTTQCEISTTTEMATTTDSQTGAEISTTTIKEIETCQIVETEIAKIMVFSNPHWSLGSLAENGSLATTDNQQLTTDNEQPTILDQFTLAIKKALEKLGLIIQNGIAKVKELFAEKVTTKQLCIEGEDGETICVDKARLKELLSQPTPGVGGSSGGGSPPPSPEICDSTHLNLCQTEADCQTAGGYWYSGTCNAESERVK